MNLRELSEGLATGADDASIEISGLTADSRAVRPGFLFAALAGTRTDGARFVADAQAAGASAVLAAPDTVLETSLPILRAPDARRALALMAARLAGPQPDHIVAVTGTAGKTSVAAFLRQIWARAGKQAASIGTTGLVSPTRTEYGSLTTPEPVALANLLAELAREGVTHVSMEASSHGLEQRRLDGLTLRAAGFTNLGRDHMDYHASVEEYFAAKMRLFDTLLPKGRPAVIFADDRWSGAAIEAAQKAGASVMTVGREGGFLKLKRLEHERRRQVAEIEVVGKLHRIVLPLAGEFQMSNALVAAGLAIASGVNIEDALHALEYLEGAPGRLELAGTTAAGVPVYVDYAHKPEALENVLSAVRPFTTGRVIVVFGCGGDRDRGKRPIMGGIATRLADIAILTDDNPRSEEAAAIRAEVLEGAPGAEEIGDRRQAIREAISRAGAGDTVVIAGKGHENGQTIGAQTFPFSDHEEVRLAIADAPR
ncbi:UDP-N-acetylmuramoyl-L-alanyl-D-glutamate--2,6-diaminopimelate ligase [Aureimonas populi]|uniref:UDP-N-acetylmuramoyl-L-alanyl-D-glutamate--2,6-diaminopimelate ligase n=1 Tax=Aureimonas populi TaxID=1701758 RepID=A0ABW5CMD0_9HYPH|nr:UDP-N-acetylmuramoyl-L-alanyl-D-glutamate--2,6-diaminopimelate ligase [Aureimonas populi]